jgi:hypothetical protein
MLCYMKSARNKCVMNRCHPFCTGPFHSGGTGASASLSCIYWLAMDTAPCGSFCAGFNCTRAKAVSGSLYALANVVKL